MAAENVNSNQVTPSLGGTSAAKGNPLETATRYTGHFNTGHMLLFFHSTGLLGVYLLASQWT